MPGRGFATLAVFALALTVGATTASANNGHGNGNGGATTTTTYGAATGATVQPDLLADATANPKQMFAVIVQAQNKGNANSIHSYTAQNGSFGHQFNLINGVNAKLPGSAIVLLSKAKQFGRLTITRDAPVAMMGDDPDQLAARDRRGLALDGHARALRRRRRRRSRSSTAASTPREAPTSARASSRASTSPRSPRRDGRPRGPRHDGRRRRRRRGPRSTRRRAEREARRRPHVANANGESRHERRDRRHRLDPRAQGRSTTSASSTSRWPATTQTSFQLDPLDKAVEKLWFNGIVVVAAAGNNGIDGAADMSLRAPATTRS